MITVLSGTNRPASRTRRFADHFADLLAHLGQPAQLLDLTDVPAAYFTTTMYEAAAVHPELRRLQQRYVLEADKLAIFVPEYNGSYPGVLKLFVDGISVNDYAENFRDKRVALVGVSSGRAGNLRGVDHLSDVIAHMGGWVLPNRLPISGVHDLLAADGRLTDAATEDALRQLARQLIAA